MSMARYDGAWAGSEALFDEADTAFSNSGINTGGAYTANSGVGGTTGFGTTGQLGGNPALLGNEGESGNAYSVGRGMDTAQAEDLGAGQTFNQMGPIEKVAVTAKSRALKAEYSLELAQDLKAIHGLNAEAELANILSTEILAEINREVIRTIYKSARPGAQETLLTLVALTSTLIPTVAGLLRSSRVSCSKSSVKQTLSPKRLVEGRAT